MIFLTQTIKKNAYKSLNFQPPRRLNPFLFKSLLVLSGLDVLLPLLLRLSQQHLERETLLLHMLIIELLFFGLLPLDQRRPHLRLLLHALLQLRVQATLAAVPEPAHTSALAVGRRLGRLVKLSIHLINRATVLLLHQRPLLVLLLLQRLLLLRLLLQQLLEAFSRLQRLSAYPLYLRLIPGQAFLVRPAILRRPLDRQLRLLRCRRLLLALHLADLLLVDADHLQLLQALLLPAQELFRVVEGVHEVAQPVGNVRLEHNMAEKRGQRQREVAFSPQRDVPVARLQTVERQHPLANQLARLLEHPDAQAGQVRQDDLAEHERVLVVVRIEAVVGDGLRAELAPDRVSGQAVHVDLDVGADALLRQELAGYDLDGAECGDDAVHGRLAEGVEVLVGAAQEVGLEQVAAVAVVLELALVQLHAQVGRLEVERDHLAAGVPEDLGHVVGGVDAAAFRVDARQLTGVVVDELDGVLAHLAQGHVLVEGGHVVVDVLGLGVVEALELDGLRVVDEGAEERVDVGGGAGVLVLVQQRPLFFFAQLAAAHAALLHHYVVGRLLAAGLFVVVHVVLGVGFFEDGSLGLGCAAVMGAARSWVGGVGAGCVGIVGVVGVCAVGGVVGVFGFIAFD